MQQKIGNVTNRQQILNSGTDVLKLGSGVCDGGHVTGCNGYLEMHTWHDINIGELLTLENCSLKSTLLKTRIKIKMDV